MSKKLKDRDNVEYKLRDVVLGKIRGYPPWPGMVVDPDDVPEAVKQERPKGKYLCVRFFPVGDYSWLPPKEIVPLEKHEIEAYVNDPPKKSGELLKGYRVALDPAKWEEERVAALAANEDAEAEMDVDQLDGEDEDGGSKGRKRKRSAPTKKRGGSGGDEKKPKRRGGKKNGLSAETVESEDDGAGDEHGRDDGGAKRKKTDKEDEDAKWAHLKNDPEAVKIKGVRHTLQRAFLRKTGPLESEMEESDKLFKDLEEQEISIDYLSYSKIGKVMRHIASLDEEQMPGGDKHDFRKRAGDLVARWHKILGTKAPLPTAAHANGAAAGTRRPKSEVKELEKATGLKDDGDAPGDLTVLDES